MIYPSFTLFDKYKQMCYYIQPIKGCVYGYTNRDEEMGITSEET